jgi:hypothetical protein
VPQKMYSARSPLTHDKEKHLANLLVCRVYFLTLGKLTCLRSVFFSTWQTKFLLSAKEKTLGKKKFKSHFEVVNLFKLKTPIGLRSIKLAS